MAASTSCLMIEHRVFVALILCTNLVFTFTLYNGGVSRFLLAGLLLHASKGYLFCHIDGYMSLIGVRPLQPFPARSIALRLLLPDNLGDSLLYLCNIFVLILKELPLIYESVLLLNFAFGFVILKFQLVLDMLVKVLEVFW